MYYDRSRRRSSLRRVLVLLILIGAGIFVIAHQNEVRQRLIPPPTPTATRTARSYVVEAESLLETGNLNAAIRAYIQVVSLDPENVEVLMTMSRLMALADRTEEAVHQAEHAVQLAPKNVQAQAALTMALDWHASWLEEHGRALEAKATYDKAIAAGKIAIAVDPNYAEAHAYMAETYADLNDWEDATDEAQQAVDLNPNRVDVQRALGYVRESQGNYRGAVDAYEKAIQLSPHLAYLYVALGRNYRVLVDWPKAIAAFTQAAQIDPTYVTAQDELGWTQYLLEDYRQAQKTLEKAIEVDPEAWSPRSHLAATYFVRRNYEDATTTFKKALELMNQTFDGDHYCVTSHMQACERMVVAYATMGLAYCYLEQSQPGTYQNEAMPAFRKALALRPDDPGVLGTMSYCYQSLGTPIPNTPTPRP